MPIQETGHVQINIVFNLSWHDVCTGLEISARELAHGSLHRFKLQGCCSSVFMQLSSFKNCILNARSLSFAAYESLGMARIIILN
jgi:hypothetical protein